MITINDFSETTKVVFEEAKKGNIAPSDFIEILIDSDFDRKEIKTFVKKNFGKVYLMFV